jgi:hypothetical protein
MTILPGGTSPAHHDWSGLTAAASGGTNKQYHDSEPVRLRTMAKTVMWEKRAARTNLARSSYYCSREPV